MTAQPNPEPEHNHPGPDPRELSRIEARFLIVNQQAQREVIPERVARIINEFSWDLFEPITVTEDDRGYMVVVEGQTRTLAIQQIDRAILVPAIVLRPLSEPEQAETALGITKGRSGHTALDQWMLRYVVRASQEINAAFRLAWDAKTADRAEDRAWFEDAHADVRAARAYLDRLDTMLSDPEAREKAITQSTERDDIAELRRPRSLSVVATSTS